MTLDVSVRSVQCTLIDCSYLKVCKAELQHGMKPHHRKRCVEGVERHVTRGTEVRAKTIFSEEKESNLDSPDNLSFYWYYPRREGRIFSKRQNGGGGVMLWVAFPALGQSELAILLGNQDSESCRKNLERYVLPYANTINANGWGLKQNNASIHISGHTKRWFSDRSMKILDWAAKIPDLNRIETVSGKLARRVYAEMRQLQLIEDLKTSGLEKFCKLELEYLINPLESTPQRFDKILRH